MALLQVCQLAHSPLRDVDDDFWHKPQSRALTAFTGESAADTFNAMLPQIPLWYFSNCIYNAHRTILEAFIFCHFNDDASIPWFLFIGWLRYFRRICQLPPLEFDDFLILRVTPLMRLTFCWWYCVMAYFADCSIFLDRESKRKLSLAKFLGLGMISRVSQWRRLQKLMMIKIKSFSLPPCHKARRAHQTSHHAYPMLSSGAVDF